MFNSFRLKNLNERVFSLYRTDEINTVYECNSLNARVCVWPINENNLLFKTSYCIFMSNSRRLRRVFWPREFCGFFQTNRVKYNIFKRLAPFPSSPFVELTKKSIYKYECVLCVYIFIFKTTETRSLFHNCNSHSLCPRHVLAYNIWGHWHHA